MLTKKTTVDGVLLKSIKVRLALVVLGIGSLQSSADLEGGTLRSPTLAINTVLLQITRAAALDRHICVFDVGQAFLNSRLNKKGDEIVMELKREVAEALIQVDETCRQYQRSD